VPAALLVSVIMLGLGGTDALAQRQATKLDGPNSAATGKRFTLPGMGEGERSQSNVQGAVKTTLNYPYGVTVDPSGKIYVANVFGGVNIYSSTYKLLGEITAGTSYPAAVAVDFSGNIYVANNGGNNITIYNPSFQQTSTITDPTLDNPTSMYIDANDDVWVLDATGVLHLYLDNGASGGTVTTGGTAVGPWGPFVTVWGIADGSGSYTEHYQNVGETLHYGPELQNSFPGSSEAGGEAQDSLSQQYVTDIINNQVHIWSTNGENGIGTITTAATPYGIAVDNVRRRILVTETTANLVVVYSLVPPYKLLASIH
jgi:hypothetical protein